MRTTIPAAVPLLAILVLSAGGCSVFEATGFAPNRPDPEAVKLTANGTVPPRAEPDRVVVRHVLIGFDGAKAPTRTTTRTQAEAERLAAKVLNLATSGRDFGELARLYSDDRHGTGTYTLTNFGVGTGEGEFSRPDMARAFADAAFALEPGGLVLVPYDPATSPLGWHVIRRER